MKEMFGRQVKYFAPLVAFTLFLIERERESLTDDATLLLLLSITLLSRIVSTLVFGDLFDNFLLFSDGFLALFFDLLLHVFLCKKKKKMVVYAQDTHTHTDRSKAMKYKRRKKEGMGGMCVYMREGKTNHLPLFPLRKTSLPLPPPY